MASKPQILVAPNPIFTSPGEAFRRGGGQGALFEKFFCQRLHVYLLMTINL